MVKTSLIKAYLGGWTGVNMQDVGKRRKKRKKKNIAAKKKLIGYRKEEVAILKRKKKINKTLSNKSNLMPKYKIKPLKLNTI